MSEPYDLISPKFREALIGVMEKCVAKYIQQIKHDYISQLEKLLKSTSFKTNRNLKYAIFRYVDGLKLGFLRLSEESRAKRYLKRRLDQVCEDFDCYSLLKYERDQLRERLKKYKTYEQQDILGQLKTKDHELIQLRQDFENNQQTVNQHEGTIGELREENRRLNDRNEELEETCEGLKIKTVDLHRKLEKVEINSHKSTSNLQAQIDKLTNALTSPGKRFFLSSQDSEDSSMEDGVISSEAASSEEQSSWLSHLPRFSFNTVAETSSTTAGFGIKRSHGYEY